MRSIVPGLVALALTSACSTSVGDHERPTPVEAEAWPELEPEPEPELEPSDQPMRVLVTGFNDWRELGDPPNVWRCRDNPSCRLLLGEAHEAEPREFGGPLVARLEAAAPAIEWRFATMPVTWGAFADVPTDVDVIVNIGLGVYDRFDVLQLEAGAYNLRNGVDAAGRAQPGPIAEGEAVLDAPAASPIAGRLASLAGRTLAGYEIVVAEAREANSYLCNETHFHALTTLARSDGRLAAVYFLHIPHANDGDYEALAAGVAAVVLELARPGDPKRPVAPG